jgi:hypothetical protein
MRLSAVMGCPARVKIGVSLSVALLAAYGCDPRVTKIGALTRAAAVDAAPDAETSGAAADAGTGKYLEAESGELSGGFVIVNDPSASGGQYITPQVGVTSDTDPGTARASYQLVAETAGTYLIWGTHSGA